MQVFDPEWRKPYPNVERYFMTCAQQPEFRKVMGDVVLCSAAPTRESLTLMYTFWANSV